MTPRPGSEEPVKFRIDGRKIKSVNDFYREIGRSVNGPGGYFGRNLDALADWLWTCGITPVALESTGVYWIPLFELLEARGFQVFLVDPSKLPRNGRPKTDVHDCQWLQRLHTYG